MDSLGILLGKGRILKIYSKKKLGCNGSKILILPKNNDIKVIFSIFYSFNCLNLNINIFYI